MLKNLINKLKDVRNLPKNIGNVVLEHSIDNFRKQSFDKQPWQMRKDGDTSRNLLVLSGKLRRSLRVSEANWRKIVISSDLAYAKIHNEGGKIPVTAKMKKFFWAKYKSTKKPHWKTLATTKKTHLQIPQRQFVGIDDALKSKIQTIYYDTFNKIFR
ncbi:phage virion morphogenesis protein [Raineya sp.]